MGQASSLEQSYLVLIEFLMLSKRQIIEAADEFGLTGMQAMTLFLLDRPRPMNSFGKIFNCDPSNVTGIIDGLEAKNLAKRFENPKDRRIKMVELCDEGLPIRDALLSGIAGPDSPILQNLTPEEVTEFIRLADKITTTQSSEVCTH
jgi:DNA-binding MarR family transcriptional regulator